MAGPCSTILLRQALTASGQERIRADISALADPVKGNDFWIDGAPFLVSFPAETEDGHLLDAYRDKLSDYDWVEALTGWPVRYFFDFCAMCNGLADHRQLGRLCIRFARAFDGLIAFGARLEHYSEDPVLLHHPGLIAWDNGNAQHLMTPDCLEVWLQHPDFRMVK